MNHIDNIIRNITVTHVLSDAYDLIGTPYKWGGQSKRDGFDCSGFVVHLARKYKSIPSNADYTAAGLYAGAPEIPYPIPGSVVYYQDGESITHCMLVISNAYCVGASGQAVCIQPINYRVDIVGFNDFIWYRYMRGGRKNA